MYRFDICRRLRRRAARRRRRRRASRARFELKLGVEYDREPRNRGQTSRRRGCRLRRRRRRRRRRRELAEPIDRLPPPPTSRSHRKVLREAPYRSTATDCKRRQWRSGVAWNFARCALDISRLNRRWTVERLLRGGVWLKKHGKQPCRTRKLAWLACEALRAREHWELDRPRRRPRAGAERDRAGRPGVVHRQ